MVELLPPKGDWYQPEEGFCGMPRIFFMTLGLFKFLVSDVNKDNRSYIYPIWGYHTIDFFQVSSKETCLKGKKKKNEKGI